MLLSGVGSLGDGTGHMFFGWRRETRAEAMLALAQRIAAGNNAALCAGVPAVVKGVGTRCKLVWALSNGLPLHASNTKQQIGSRRLSCVRRAHDTASPLCPPPPLLTRRQFILRLQPLPLTLNLSPPTAHTAAHRFAASPRLQFSAPRVSTRQSQEQEQSKQWWSPSSCPTTSMSRPRASILSPPRRTSSSLSVRSGPFAIGMPIGLIEPSQSRPSPWRLATPRPCFVSWRCVARRKSFSTATSRRSRWWSCTDAGSKARPSLCLCMAGRGSRAGRGCTG